MDIWEYYDQVRALIRELDAAGLITQARKVENALAGSTSGEVLTNLAVALPLVAATIPNRAAGITELADWAGDALKPRR